MKKLIILACLFATPALAQAPTDAEIAAAWAICEPYEVIGKLAARVPWRADAPARCPKIREAYLKSKPGIEAKAAADKNAADAAVVDALANRIK